MELLSVPGASLEADLGGSPKSSERSCSAAGVCKGVKA